MLKCSTAPLVDSCKEFCGVYSKQFVRVFLASFKVGNNDRLVFLPVEKAFDVSYTYIFQVRMWIGNSYHTSVAGRCPVRLFGTWFVFTRSGSFLRR